MKLSFISFGSIGLVISLVLFSGCGSDKKNNSQASTGSNESISSASSSIQSSSGPAQLQIVPVAEEGGTISPSQTQTVTADDSITFTVTAQPGYKVEAITGCNGSGGNLYDPGGKMVVKTLEYRVSLIKESCTVHVTFEKSLATLVADIDTEFARCVDNQSLGMTQLEQLKSLRCGGNRLRSIKGVEAFTGLEEITLSYSYLSGNIDLSALSQLKKFSSFYDGLDGVNVSQNANLEEFIYTAASGVDINNFQLGLTNKPKLRVLSLGSSHEPDVDLPGVAMDFGSLPMLESLRFGYVNFASVIFSSQNTALKNLSFNNAELNSLDITNLVNLEELYIPYNKLTALDLSGNINLKRLNINDNLLVELDLTGLSGLAYVWAPSNRLESVTGVASVLDKRASLTFSLNPLNATTLAAFSDLKNVQGYENLKY